MTVTTAPHTSLLADATPMERRIAEVLARAQCGDEITDEDVGGFLWEVGLVDAAIGANDLLAAAKGILSFAEAAEAKALVGDEGCLWPVEELRVAIARAEGR